MLDGQSDGKKLLKKYLVIAVCIFVGGMVIGCVIMNFPALFLGA